MSGQETQLDPNTCFVPGCGKPAAGYLQDGQESKRPLCEECGDRFLGAQNTHAETHTAAKVVLAAMRAARKHFVGLHNPQTGDVAFLGAGEITRYPSLYDDAISRGEIPVGFFALRPTAASAADRVAYYAWDIDTFPGYDRAELTRRVMAYCMPKCEGFEEPCNRPAAAQGTTAIRPGIGAEKHWFCMEHAARIKEYLDSVCWMPGCGKQAVDYAESPTHGKFPLCAEHAREFRAVQDAYDTTNLS